MRKSAGLLLIVLLAQQLYAQPVQSQPDKVQPTAIKAACRNGQTFVTWTDAAEGEAGSMLRYSLYRSDKPITQDNLDRATLCYHGVLNNSAKLIGHAYFMKDRINGNGPTCIIE